MRTSGSSARAARMSSSPTRRSGPCLASKWSWVCTPTRSMARDGSVPRPKAQTPINETRAREDRMERDPVCGMELMPGKEEAEVQHDGKTYHFCSRECRDLFVKNPADYLQADANA